MIGSDMYQVSARKSSSRSADTSHEIYYKSAIIRRIWFDVLVFNCGVATKTKGNRVV